MVREIMAGLCSSERLLV